MYYDGSQWIRPDAINNPQNFPDSHHLSNIQLVRSNADLVFRIIAIRDRDSKRIVNQHIFHRLKYKEATPSFHQWRNEHKQVIGLNFTNEQDAKMFYEAVKQVLDNISQLVSPSIQPLHKAAPLSSAPPPPPPPPDLKSLLAGKHQSSFADKLKGVKLRKGSAVNGMQNRTVSPSNSVGSSNGSGSVPSKFQSQDLISELSDRLSKRKMTVEASTTTSVNGTQNHPNRTNIQQILSVNNAKGSAGASFYGRIPSVSSLSSQDDANANAAAAETRVTAGAISAAPSSAANNAPVNGQASAATRDDNANAAEARAKAPITSNDWDQMKAELMDRISNELQSLKRELTQTIRDEVAKLSVDQR